MRHEVRAWLSKGRRGATGFRWTICLGLLAAPHVGCRVHRSSTDAPSAAPRPTPSPALIAESIPDASPDATPTEALPPLVLNDSAGPLPTSPDVFVLVMGDAAGFDPSLLRESAVYAARHAGGSGGDATDAVAAALRYLEARAPSLHADAIVRSDGQRYYDAYLMRDAKHWGAVAAIAEIRHPSQLAWHALEKQLGLMVGEAALRWGKQADPRWVALPPRAPLRDTGAVLPPSVKAANDAGQPSKPPSPGGSEGPKDAAPNPHSPMDTQPQDASPTDAAHAHTSTSPASSDAGTDAETADANPVSDADTLPAADDAAVQVQPTDATTTPHVTALERRRPMFALASDAQGNLAAGSVFSGRQGTAPGQASPLIQPGRWLWLEDDVAVAISTPGVQGLPHDARELSSLVHERRSARAVSSWASFHMPPSVTLALVRKREVLVWGDSIPWVVWTATGVRTGPEGNP